MKGVGVSDTQSKRLTNHNRVGQMTNQSKPSFLEAVQDLKWSVSDSRLKKKRRRWSSIQYETNNVYFEHCSM